MSPCTRLMTSASEASRGRLHHTSPVEILGSILAKVSPVLTFRDSRRLLLGYRPPSPRETFPDPNAVSRV